MKMQKLLITLALTTAASSSKLEAPCYGYGELIGYPGSFLRDDIIRARESKVGQSDVYVGGIKYSFSSRQHIQFLYMSENDSDFFEEGWEHGDQPRQNFEPLTVYSDGPASLYHPETVMIKVKGQDQYDRS